VKFRISRHIPEHQKREFIKNRKNISALSDPHCIKINNKNEFVLFPEDAIFLSVFRIGTKWSLFADARRKWERTKRIWIDFYKDEETVKIIFLFYGD